MCMMQKAKPIQATPIMADPNGNEASNQADIEARLRRRRAGAAADVLTGPRGIPATKQLGNPA